MRYPAPSSDSAHILIRVLFVASCTVKLSVFHFLSAAEDCVGSTAASTLPLSTVPAPSAETR